MANSFEKINSIFSHMSIKDGNRTELQLQTVRSFKEWTWTNDGECITALEDLRHLLSLIDDEFASGSFQHAIFQMNPDTIRSEIVRNIIVSLKKNAHIPELVRPQLREVVVELIGIFETTLVNQFATTDNWATEGQA